MAKTGGKNSYGKLIWVMMMGILIWLNLMTYAYGKMNNEVPYWQVIMAEAVSEGYDGMYAVACVIRNRKGSLDGFYGARRKDLVVFCEKQGKKYIMEAKRIERYVFHENSFDTTGGATHFENIEVFGVPYWAKKMRVTSKIGRHTFYK